MQTGKTNFIYKNELDKACFQLDMVYDKSKDLVKRTQSDKFQRDKAFKLQIIQNKMVIKKDQLQWFTSLFDKKLVSLNKSSGSDIANEPNYQLANELHKPIIRNFSKIKIDSSFRDNIWSVNLADMQSLT